MYLEVFTVMGCCVV